MIKYFFLILIMCSIQIKDCTAQTIDTAFVKAFYKNHVNRIDGMLINDDEIVYFEAVKLNNKFVLSILKGVHSKLLYERIYKTLERIDASSINKDVVRYIYFNRKFPRGALHDLEYKPTSRRIVNQFKLKYNIDEDVKLLVNSYSDGPIR